MAHSRIQRIIPACAGNSSPWPAAPSERADHPRVCGEQPRSVPSWPNSSGSSPRVRGTVSVASCRYNERRIIPACAGNSESLTRPHRPFPDHPRVCGEQTIRDTKVTRFGGSSPRVRGTGGPQRLHRLDGRIIPACAGNSTASSGNACEGSDHPRVCGEQSCGRCRECLDAGSSPRVRGTGYYRSTGLELQRIIPACAGNSSAKLPAGHWLSDHPRVCGEQIWPF